MNTSCTFLDPKKVLIQTPQGDKFIIGFHSEMNYQMEQQAVPFLKDFASFFDSYYQGDESVIMGEINRQLFRHRYESIFSYQRDYVQNRIIVGERIRSLRELRQMDLDTLALKSSIQPNTLRRIEAGRLSVDLDVLSRIAQGLGMKIDFVELNNDERDGEIIDECSK